MKPLLSKLSILFIPLLIVGVISGCEDDLIIIEQPIPDPCPNGYEQYSTDTFDFVYDRLINPWSAIGPFYYPIGDILGRPVFNPNNPMEIAYTITRSGMGLNEEVWKFNFCTGEKTLLATNCYYGLDWGANGWLLYTGTGHRMHKIKSNGDSLKMVFDQAGFNKGGKWNPSGTIYYIYGTGGERYLNAKDEVILPDVTTLISPLGWLGDSTVLGYDSSFKLHSQHLPSGTITMLNNHWISSDPSKMIDLDNMACFEHQNHLIRYSLNGDNRIDTIREMAISYRYVSGSYIDNKLITVLVRQDWKDSVANEINVWSDLLLLNADGTEERLVVLP